MTVQAIGDVDAMLAPGERLGKYRIRKVLGRGGMGAIYEAVHVDLRKRVALKILLPRHASNREARLRFLREGEAASRIRHPNVVDVTDVGIEDGVPFLVMEYLVGETLEDKLVREGPMEFGRAVDLMLPVLSAVAEGHRKGVVHRDLKPQNLFISSDRVGEPVPVVLDFGISKLKDAARPEALTETSSFLGTVLYMSPEQARGAARVDGRSDLHSLAVVLYRAVTGKTPHAGETSIEILYKIATGDIVPARQVRPDLPEAFANVLSRAMHVNPDQRFDGVASFAAALLPFSGARAREYWGREFLGPSRLATPAPPPGDMLRTSGALVAAEGFAETTARMDAAHKHAEARGRRVLVAGALAGLACVALVAWLLRGTPAPVTSSARPGAAGASAVTRVENPRALEPGPAKVTNTTTVATTPPAKTTTSVGPAGVSAVPTTARSVAARAQAATVARRQPAPARSAAKQANRGSSAHTVAPERGTNNALIIA